MLQSWKYRVGEYERATTFSPRPGHVVFRVVEPLSCRGEGRLIGWQKVMSFHVGCTHAGTRVTSWLHGCFRSTCRSIEFPIVTLREIRSVLTFPNIRNHEGKTKEGLTKRRWEKIWLANHIGHNDEKLNSFRGDPQVVAGWNISRGRKCRKRGMNFGKWKLEKVKLYIYIYSILEIRENDFYLGSLKRTT